jgi:hypothetical protein
MGGEGNKKNGQSMNAANRPVHEDKRRRNWVEQEAEIQ